jgi:hypothetical protein
MWGIHYIQQLIFFSLKKLRNILIVIMKTVILEGFIDKINLNQMYFQYYQQKKKNIFNYCQKVFQRNKIWNKKPENEEEEFEEDYEEDFEENGEKHEKFKNKIKNQTFFYYYKFDFSTTGRNLITSLFDSILI